MNKCDICKYKDCTMKETEERRATCKEDGLFERDMSDFTAVKTTALLNQSESRKELLYSRKDFIEPTIRTLMLLGIVLGKVLSFEEVEIIANEIVDKHVHKASYSATEYMTVANKIMKDLEDVFE